MWISAVKNSAIREEASKRMNDCDLNKATVPHNFPSNVISERKFNNVDAK